MKEGSCQYENKEGFYQSWLVNQSVICTKNSKKMIGFNVDLVLYFLLDLVLKFDMAMGWNELSFLKY